MIPLQPLWAADWDKIIPILVVIVFFIISAMGRWISKLGQAPRPGGGARRPQAPPPGRPIQVAPGGDADDEIAEFLRRAVQQQRGGRPPQQAELAEVVEPEVLPGPVGGQVSRHVGEHLDTAKFRRRASQLGDEVAHADDQMDQRLHQKFDHRVGRLVGTAGESAEAAGVEEATEPEDRVIELPTTAAAGLPVLLSSAQNIRQAIVISEILNRPEDRWT